MTCNELGYTFNETNHFSYYLESHERLYFKGETNDCSQQRGDRFSRYWSLVAFRACL